MKKGRALAHGALSSKKIRFGLVGVVNTSVDFALLFILAKLFGVPTIAANTVSTSCAMAVSYLLNKNSVFGNTNRSNRRQVVLFIVVTLFGLWVVQAVVIGLVLAIFSTAADDPILLFAAKSLATLVSLVWNYLWYSRVVFAPTKLKRDKI